MSNRLVALDPRTAQNPFNMRNIQFETVLKFFSNYDPNLVVEHFSVTPGSQKVHYCSLMYQILVSLKKQGHSERTEVRVLIKTVPDNPLRLDYIREGKLFIKEIIMYTQIVPDIMARAGLRDAFPLVYDTFAKPEGTNYYLVMEDLTELGYYPYKHRVAGLDETHAKLVIQKLAHFHAASFISHRGDGHSILSEYPEVTEHFWKTDLDNGKVPDMNHAFIFNTAEQIKRLLAKCGQSEKNVLVEKYLARGHDTLSKFGRVPEKFPSVITHGDAWTTNILFKYDDLESENLVDLKFVDFQMIKVASRITDLSYFIFTSISNKVLNCKIPELLQLYFHTFNRACVKFGGLELPLAFHKQTLSWDFFMEEWNHFKAYGLISALLYISIMYTDPQNPPDMENIEEADVKPLDENATGTFDSIWEYEPMRAKLLNLISNHL